MIRQFSKIHEDVSEYFLFFLLFIFERKMHLQFLCIDEVSSLKLAMAQFSNFKIT